MSTINPSANGGVPYRVPPEPSRVPSIILAIVVHAGLLLFLWSGIRWQNTEPIAVEAEVWDMSIKAAAAPPEPEPEPEREPEPEPIKRVPLPPVEAPVTPKAPDIALERLKEQKQKKLQEQKLAEQRRELEKKELEKKELEKKKLEQELAEKKALEKAEKLAKAKKEALEQAALKKMREADLKRMVGALGEAGDAQKSAGPKGDPTYGVRIAAKIRPLIQGPGVEDLPANLEVEFKIDQLPSGEVMSARMIKSSGNKIYDEAVERAITLASPLPKNKDGTVQKSITLTFRPKERN